MKQPRMNRILEKAFPGLKIADAKKPLTLFPVQSDWDEAVRMDPSHCGFANCAHRVCGATQAHFFSRYAYIDHPGEDGVRRVYRYCISSNVYDMIVAFDRGEKIKGKPRAFTLRAPQPSETLEAQRKQHKQWRKTNVAKAIVAERAAQSELRRSERELEQAVALAKTVDAPSASTKAKEVERRVTAAKIQTKRARIRVETAAERVMELRKATYGTGRAKPRLRDITVRSGTGAWFRNLAMHHG